MLLVAVVDSSLSDNGKLAVIFELIAAIWMILEVVELAELISDEVVADNHGPHIHILHVFGVSRAATSQNAPQNIIDWSHDEEDRVVCKIEDQVDVKVGRPLWHQANLKFFF